MLKHREVEEGVEVTGDGCPVCHAWKLYGGEKRIGRHHENCVMRGADEVVEDS